MTRDHKITLIQFVLRTGMYVRVVDQESIASFIAGLELGSNNYDLTDLLKKHLAENHHIEYSADGWNGQIKRYSDKFNTTWTSAFKELCLEVISNDGELDDEMQALIKAKKNLPGRENN